MVWSDRLKESPELVVLTNLAGQEIGDENFATVEKWTSRLR
jgi:hypothetical protein